MTLKARDCCLQMRRPGDMKVICLCLLFVFLVTRALIWNHPYLVALYMGNVIKCSVRDQII